MKIQVTQKHINAGRRKSAYNCPIAQALKDEFPKSTELWSVGPKSCSGFGRGTFQLPKDAQQFVADFDHGLPVQPFEFELNVNQERTDNEQNDS